MTRLTGVTWLTRRDDAVRERINDEVITAKQIRKDRPEITWTEALKTFWIKIYAEYSEKVFTTCELELLRFKHIEPNTQTQGETNGLRS
jgi:hypothetical protein